MVLDGWLTCSLISMAGQGCFYIQFVYVIVRIMSSLGSPHNAMHSPSILHLGIKWASIMFAKIAWILHRVMK